MNYTNTTALAAGSTATSINSNPVVISHMQQASAQCITTGTGVGTVQFQVSNDASNPTNWTAIGSPVNVTAASTVLIPAVAVCYMYLRVAYVSTSGTGTITINITTNAV